MAMTAAELIKADQEHLIHPRHHPIDNAEPMIYVRGRGAMISDIGGKEYLDGLSGLWNVNVGHGRTELADAAAQQMKELAYFSGYVGSSSVPAITLASRLLECSGDMAGIFFTTGGAGGKESGFKTARFYWKTKGKPDKGKGIARQQGYHGVTLQAMSATGMPAYWKMFEPRVPGFVHIQTCYPYRFQGAKPGETVGQAAARELEEAILREGPDTVAAFIGEPIHGGGGVIYPTDDYWPRVREVCTRHNVLLIADEVITGFCRTGRWFALAHWNVKPDILSFAKGLRAAVELVEDRATKTNFAADRKVAARIQAEMMKRGVVTRTRAVVGPHPAPGDAIYFAPPLIVTEAEIERIVGVARDAVQAVLCP